MSGLGLPSRYLAYPLAPVGSDRQLPGYPYGMRGMGAPPQPIVGGMHGVGAPMMPAGPGMYPGGVGAPLMPMPGGMHGLGRADYPAAPVPMGLPAQSYWQLPPYYTHTMGYKDALAAAGLEFHTETFDLQVDPVAQSGAAIAVGGTVIATVRISQEADFVAEKIVADQLPAAALWTVQVFDNATNRALSNAAIRNSNFAGTAQRPRLIKPRLFRRNSDVSFVFTNVDAVPITALQVMFQGFKIFDPNALNLNNPQ